jgi:hypothetical protein
VLILGSFLLQMDLQRLPSYRVHSPFHVPELISRRLIRVDVPLNHSWDFKCHLQADRVLKSWIFDGTSGAVHSESWVCMGASFQRSARSNTGFLEFWSWFRLHRRIHRHLDTNQPVRKRQIQRQVSAPNTAPYTGFQRASRKVSPAILLPWRSHI